MIGAPRRDYVAFGLTLRGRPAGDQPRWREVVELGLLSVGSDLWTSSGPVWPMVLEFLEIGAPGEIARRCAPHPSLIARDRRRLSA
jgi:hypothetical protein